MAIFVRNSRLIMTYASIDSVYSSCQEILGKDEKGFFTPTQYNLYARDAQGRVARKIISGYVEGAVHKGNYLSRQAGIFSKVDSNKNLLLPLLRRNVALSGTVNVFNFPTDYMIQEGQDSVTVNGSPATISTDGMLATYNDSYSVSPNTNVPVAEIDYATITLYPIKSYSCILR